MSQSLQSALNWVNFELRLRPSPELLARKQKIIAELDAEWRETTAIIAAIPNPPPPNYQPAFPTGEEDFRCAGCNLLLPFNQLHRALCPACRTDL